MLCREIIRVGQRWVDLMLCNEVNALHIRVLKRGVNEVCCFGSWCVTIHSSEHLYVIQS